MAKRKARSAGRKDKRNERKLVTPLKLDLDEGALHEQMGIAMGHKIPVAKLEEAKHSKKSKTRKRANFALVARKWNHQGGRGHRSGSRGMSRTERSIAKAVGAK